MSALTVVNLHAIFLMNISIRRAMHHLNRLKVLVEEPREKRTDEEEEEKDEDEGRYSSSSADGLNSAQQKPFWSERPVYQSKGRPVSIAVSQCSLFPLLCHVQRQQETADDSGWGLLWICILDEKVPFIWTLTQHRLIRQFMKCVLKLGDVKDNHTQCERRNDWTDKISTSLYILQASVQLLRLSKYQVLICECANMNGGYKV